VLARARAAARAQQREAEDLTREEAALGQSIQHDPTFAGRESGDGLDLRVGVARGTRFGTCGLQEGQAFRQRAGQHGEALLAADSSATSRGATGLGGAETGVRTGGSIKAPPAREGLVETFRAVVQHRGTGWG